MRSVGQLPTPPKRILELNAEHPIVKKLLAMAKDGSEKISDMLKTLYDQSIILEGAAPDDPADFARRVNELMSLALGE